MMYTILTGRNPDDLTTQVNDAISRGWQPLGGVACSSDGSKFNDQVWSFSQAMTQQSRPYLDLDAPTR